MRVHDNSSFCSGGDLAIHIIFCVFLVLESIAGCIGTPILGLIIYALWTYTYGHCYMSKYPTLARLGAIILPVPIVNIISISICSLIGKIKYGNKFFVEDGFDRKEEGLIFKIYTKLSFLNEPRFVKSRKYCEVYAVIRNYYVRNGFQEFAMQDRCIAAVEDGMSIIEAAQILRRITGEDPQFAKAFVESLLQIPRPAIVMNYLLFFRIAKMYNGAEFVIREIAQIFGISQKEYHDLLSVYAKRLSKCDPNFRKYKGQSYKSYEEYSDKNQYDTNGEGYGNYEQNEYDTNGESYGNYEQNENDSNGGNYGNYEQNDDAEYSNSFSGLDEYYRILECSPNSSIEEIKAAYKRLLKESHPDKLPKDSPEWVLKAANERFSKIQEAYKKIKDAKGF